MTGAGRGVLGGGIRARVPLTYFEFGTGRAVVVRTQRSTWCWKSPGGRLDATNPSCRCRRLTTVDLDHQDWLGDDREAIGFERRARAPWPLVLGDDDPRQRVHAMPWRIGDPRRQRFLLRAQRRRWLALARLGFALDRRRPGWPRRCSCAMRPSRCGIARWISTSTVGHAQGVADADLPGRLQRFERGGIEILVDVGHKPQAATELTAWLRDRPSRAHRAVYAPLGDRMWRASSGTVGRDRAMAAGRRRVPAVAASVSMCSQVGCGAEPDEAGRLPMFRKRLRGNAEQGGDRILVFGSFHAAATALRAVLR